MTVHDFDRAMLALASWQEASDMSADVMLCIAHTIMNLAQRDNISIGEAILKHKVLHGSSLDGKQPDVRDPVFVRLLQRIEEVGGLIRSDITKGAIYHVDLSAPIPEALSSIVTDADHGLTAVYG